MKVLKKIASDENLLTRSGEDLLLLKIHLNNLNFILSNQSKSPLPQLKPKKESKVRYLNKVSNITRGFNKKRKKKVSVNS